MNKDLRQMTREFLLDEAYNPPDVESYIQSLEKLLDGLKIRNVSDRRKFEVCKDLLRNIKKEVKKLKKELQEIKNQ
tara:strand:+ start:248 stop:475 length:228 start_codon:yes stop_codon:yes gene_type:complete